MNFFNYNALTVLIAALALLISWRANRNVSKSNREANDLLKKQTEFQDRLTQIEQSREHAKLIESLRAKIRAQIQKTGDNNWRLFIENIGLGTARNLIIKIDDKPLIEHPVMLKGEKEVKLIGPESMVSYCIGISFDSIPPFEFSATWDDDSGFQGTYNSTLTLN